MCPVPSRANSVNMPITDCRNPVFRSQYFFFSSRSSYKSFKVDAQLQSVFTLSNFSKVSDSDIHFLLSPQRDG